MTYHTLKKRLCFSLFFIYSLFAPAQSRKDTLWNTWKNTSKPDTVRLKAMGRLCSEFYLHQDPDSGIILTSMAFDFARKKKLTRYMGVALTKKSGMYAVKGDTEKSLFYTKESLKYFREINYELGIATCLNNMGQDYMELQRNAEAIPCFYEALKTFEKEGDKLKEATALSNIARCYEYAALTDSAITVARRCLSFCENIHVKEGIAAMNELLAGLYLVKSRVDLAFPYQQKALALAREINDQRGILSAYYNFGQIYMRKGKYDIAERFFYSSMDLALARQDSGGLAACYSSLGELRKLTGKPDEAIRLAVKGLESVHYTFQQGLTQELYALLTELYAQKKDYKNALRMHQLFIRDRDSSYKLNANTVLYQQHLNYGFEKKQLFARAENEKKVALIKAEAARKDLHKNLWLTGIIAAFLILLLGGLFLYQNFKQKTIISKQKNNILKQQLLVSQMNPHFIFNSLTAVQNFIFRQDSLQAGVYLKKFSELIRMILDFSRKDLISLSDEYIFLKNYLELQKLRFDNKLSYELKIDPQLEMDMVMIPPMLAQPFIENAIEHGIFYKNGEGFLSIKISLKENTLLYEIEDDGIGLNESLKLKSGSGKKHKSLAIEITKERLETINSKNNASFEIEIKDKALFKKETSGVYVKFATPYLTL